MNEKQNRPGFSVTTHTIPHPRDGLGVNIFYFLARLPAKEVYWYLAFLLLLTSVRISGVPFLSADTVAEKITLVDLLYYSLLMVAT
jgi:hypothetical protein